MPSRFSFFLCLGYLHSPLLSHCVVRYGFFKLDLHIELVNPPLAASRRTQPSNSSRYFHLSFVKKKAVSTSISRTLPLVSNVSLNEILQVSTSISRTFTPSFMSDSPGDWVVEPHAFQDCICSRREYSFIMYEYVLRVICNTLISRLKNFI